MQALQAVEHELAREQCQVPAVAAVEHVGAADEARAPHCGRWARAKLRIASVWWAVACRRAAWSLERGTAIMCR
jgi:hypothetical protein